VCCTDVAQEDLRDIGRYFIKFQLQNDSLSLSGEKDARRQLSSFLDYFNVVVASVTALIVVTLLFCNESMPISDASMASILPVASTNLSNVPVELERDSLLPPLPSSAPPPPPPLPLDLETKHDRLALLLLPT